MAEFTIIVEVPDENAIVTEWRVARAAERLACDLEDGGASGTVKVFDDAGQSDEFDIAS